jgi:hypothetical protein
MATQPISAPAATTTQPYWILIPSSKGPVLACRPFRAHRAGAASLKLSAQLKEKPP